MTVVNIDLATPDGTPLSGPVDFTPTMRFNVAAQVRLPTPVRVPLVAGKAAPDLEPSTPQWMWEANERVNGGKRRYVQVPAVGPVNYSSLPDIDPDTLLPAATPSPAWVAGLAGLQSQVDTLNAAPSIGIDTDGRPYLIGA